MHLEQWNTATIRKTLQSKHGAHVALELLHRNTLRYTATHCNTSHCNTLQHALSAREYSDDPQRPDERTQHARCTRDRILQHTATHCNTLQHTATHCNILQHAATHCNTLQHTATCTLSSGTQRRSAKPCRANTAHTSC